MNYLAFIAVIVIAVGVVAYLSTRKEENNVPSDQKEYDSAEEALNKGENPPSDEVNTDQK
jgi:hypothetical protein